MDIVVDYPQTSDEWQIWIERHLDIGKEEGTGLFQINTFPTEKLTELWTVEFNPSRGYSPDFIPDLIRNIQGFLRWIYCNGPEPRWKGGDSPATFQ